MVQIGEMIRDLGDKFGETMWVYFKEFQIRMHKREIIPTDIVQKYKEKICFLVGTDCCIIQAVQRRTFWVLVMGYEVRVEITKVYANILLSKLVDKKAKKFVTYEEASSKIKQDLKELIIQRRVRKMIDTLDKKYGGGASDATTSTGTSEQKGAKSNKNKEQTGEKKKMSKAKPKGIASNKLTTYTKEKDSETPASSPCKGGLVGVTYARKKKSEGPVDKKDKKKPKKDEKEGDNTHTQSDMEIKEARRSGRNVLPTTDELVHRIKEFGGLSGFGRKYPLCNEEDKRKIEDALMWNMHKFYKTPSELYGIVPSNLQNEIEGRWKTTFSIEKKEQDKSTHGSAT